MHALILTAGSAGDVFPFVDLGRNLRARGHDVTILANELFGDAVRGAEVEFVEAGSAAEFRKATANPDLWHPRKGLDVVMRDGALPALAPTVELMEKHRRDDTVLVTSTLGFGARILNERDGTPLASVHLAPSVFKSVHRMPRFAGLPDLTWMPRFLKRGFWALGDRVTDKYLVEPVNALRATYGKKPVRAIMMDWAHSPHCILGLFPEWFGTPQPDWPSYVECIGFPSFDDASRRPIDPDLDAWLDDGERPILFTAGSANVTADRFFGETVAACQRIGRRGLLATTNRDSVPSDLPSTVRHTSFVPFSAVLPRCAAMVGHGGIGTVARGLQTATPQLITPMAFDQFDNGARIEEHGVGSMLPMRKYTAKRAADALDRLIHDSAIRERCEAIREKLDPDAMTRAAQRVEALAVNASA